jgi:hypothetical protein
MCLRHLLILSWCSSDVFQDRAAAKRHADQSPAQGFLWASAEEPLAAIPAQCYRNLVQVCWDATSALSATRCLHWYVPSPDALAQLIVPLSYVKLPPSQVHPDTFGPPSKCHNASIFHTQADRKVRSRELPLAAAASLLQAVRSAEKGHLQRDLFLLYVEALAARSFKIGKADATEGVRLFFTRHHHERHELLSSGPMAATYVDLEYEWRRCSGGLRTEVLGYQIVKQAVDPVTRAIEWTVVSLITQEEEHWTMQPRLREVWSWTWDMAGGRGEWVTQQHWRAVRRRSANGSERDPAAYDIVPMPFTPPVPPR